MSLDSLRFLASASTVDGRLGDLERQSLLAVARQEGLSRDRAMEILIAALAVQQGDQPVQGDDPQAAVIDQFQVGGQGDVVIFGIRGTRNVLRVIGQHRDTDFARSR